MFHAELFPFDNKRLVRDDQLFKQEFAMVRQRAHHHSLFIVPSHCFVFSFRSDSADKFARFEMTEEGQTEADSPFTVFVLCLRFLFFHFFSPTQPQYYIMATLLPSLSSDEENDPLNDSEEEEVDDISQDFIFGGLLVRLSKVSIF